jgi:hypothetical protein
MIMSGGGGIPGGGIPDGGGCIVGGRKAGRYDPGAMNDPGAYDRVGGPGGGMNDKGADGGMTGEEEPSVGDPKAG